MIARLLTYGLERTLTSVDLALRPTPIPAPTISEGHSFWTFEGISLWKDIIFGDFFGALLAVGGSFVVALYLVAKEREARVASEGQETAARIDERRRDHAEHLAGVLRDQGLKVPDGEDRAEWKPFSAGFTGIFSASIPVLSLARDPAHEDFRRWFSRRLEELGDLEIHNAARIFVISDENKRAEVVHELRSQLLNCAIGVTTWAADPENWTPPKRSSDLAS